MFMKKNMVPRLEGVLSAKTQVSRRVIALKEAHQKHSYDNKSMLTTYAQTWETSFNRVYKYSKNNLDGRIRQNIDNFHNDLEICNLPVAEVILKNERDPKIFSVTHSKLAALQIY